MKISIVMASYLGAYAKAATNRDKKIIRAIRSVESQTYKDWELIVVADGCNETKKILKEIFWYEQRIKGFFIKKQKTWSGVPRNTGIQKATGEYICYLDVDDLFGENHLLSIVKSLNGKDWYFFDDWVYSKTGKNWRLRVCRLRIGQCGTSNVIHKPKFFWDPKATYAHDWHFINELRTSHNFGKIKGGEYCVCHIPGRLDI